ncbi:MAG: ribosomal L7Ae/L30e/S12e/Gadd45 family protein [Promethearchaeia archaeon]
MSYVKIELPDKLKQQIKNTLSIIAESDGGKIRAGLNEVTKSIERKNAKLVVMAEDVSPPEILYHIPLLCEEKKIPFAYVSKQKELGKAIGIKVSSSSVAVEDVGKGNSGILDEIIQRTEELK